MPKGEKNKLTDEQRRQIYWLKDKQPNGKTARQFNISPTMVSKIQKDARYQNEPLRFPLFSDIINDIQEEGIRGFNLSPEKMNDKPYRIIFERTCQKIRELNERRN